MKETKALLSVHWTNRAALRMTNHRHATSKRCLSGKKIIGEIIVTTLCRDWWRDVILRENCHSQASINYGRSEIYKKSPSYKKIHTVFREKFYYTYIKYNIYHTYIQAYICMYLIINCELVFLINSCYKINVIVKFILIIISREWKFI